MRNVLKNKFVYFIFLGLFIFIPKNVFADTFNTFSYLKEIRLINSSGQSTYVSGVNSSYGGWQFVVPSSRPSSIDVVRQSFVYNQFPMETGKSYIYQFLLYSYFSYSLPTVTMDNVNCSVAYSGFLQDKNSSASDMYNHVYAVTCSNVALNLANTEIAVWTTDENRVANTYGISTYITYTTSTEQNFHDISTNVEKGFNELQEAQSQTNERLDDIMSSDISDSDKEMPDDSSYQDYSGTQDEILDMTSEADLSILDVGLDVESSSWVWDTLTRILQSNSIIFGTIIAILSIGVIKLVLGR